MRSRKKMIICVIVSLITMLCPMIISAVELDVYRGLGTDELDCNVWHFSGREGIDGENARMRVTSRSCSETLAFRTDHYVFSNDSVLWTGYNVGRRIGVLVDKPCLVYSQAHFPSDGVSSIYNGVGRIDVSSIIEERGRVSVHFMGRGKAVISDGDTIANAVLMRQECRWMNDSTTGDEHERIVYRWYAPGSVVPFAIQENGNLYVDTATKVVDASENDVNQDVIRNTIDNAVVVVDGDGVTISLDFRLNLSVYVMDTAGNVYLSTGGNAKEFALNTSGLSPRQYLIVLSSDYEDKYVRKVLFTKI